MGAQGTPSAKGGTMGSTVSVKGCLFLNLYILGVVVSPRVLGVEKEGSVLNPD